jgi:hypothetical protein
MNTNVYVGNIAPDWTEQDVQKQFSGGLAAALPRLATQLPVSHGAVGSHLTGRP